MGDSTDPKKRISVRLSADEAWSVLRDGHTGIFTTLRADGYPIALPLWYATIDHKVYLSSRGKKLSRIRRNPAASLLIEGGEHWKDLWAVHLTGDAHIVEPDRELASRISADLARKYAAFRTADEKMPEATRDHYEKSTRAIIEFSPHERIVSWNNGKLNVRA